MEDWYAQTDHRLFSFILNDSVKIYRGQFAGSRGAVISRMEDNGKVRYIVEISNGRNVQVEEFDIELIGNDLLLGRKENE